MEADDRLTRTARAFFEGAASDLLGFGGVAIDQADPLKEFADPQIREFLAECGGANPRA